MADCNVILALQFNKCHHSNTDIKTLKMVNKNSILAEIFNQHHPKSNKPIAFVAKCKTDLDTTSNLFEVEGGLTVGTLVEYFKIKFIQFDCTDAGNAKEDNIRDEFDKCVSEATGKAVNAFQLLMAKGRAYPAKKEHSSGVKDGTNRKDELYNDLVDLFKTRGLDFPRSTAQTQGAYFIQVLSNALWYVTNHHTVLNDAARRNLEVLPIPPCFDSFDGYNNLKRKKVKGVQMSSTELNSHSQALLSLLLKPVVGSSAAWEEMGTQIKNLGSCFKSYKNHLEMQNKKVQSNQALNHPVRTIDEHATLECREYSPFGVGPKYKLLDNAVKAAGVDGFVLFNELTHINEPFKDGDEKLSYFRKLQLSVPVDMIRFCPGGSVKTTFCFRQVKQQRSEAEILTEGARFLQKARPELKEFHTRNEYRVFKAKLKNVATVLPSVANMIYKELALDASAAQSPVTQERLRLIFLGEPGLVNDLRSLNPGRPNDKFDTFFGVLSGILENITAADDRRHGIAHMSEFISLEEMIKKAAEECPEGTPIPSKSLVRLQFAPKNPFSRIAMNFTSKLPLQYKVQRRQLRVSHPDDHYCNAQFKYLKERAIELKNNCKLLFCDDKAKVPIGDPGHLVSTGVRGKQTIVPTSSTLCSLDHDMTKSSLTPSVTLECKVPENTSASFVRGHVTTIINDSVFQQSSPFRHAASLVKILENGTVCPVLLKFTDGGTDQRNTLEAVKCASICIFQELNLDMLILGRCAPGHSYTNPAERVMSILNLGLQNVALERKKGNDDDEKVLKQCNSMADLRNLAIKKPDVKIAWRDSIEPVQRLLMNRFARLKLKDDAFCIQDPVSEDDIDLLKRHLRELFDDLDLTKLQKAHTSKSTTYTTWLAKHARSRQYTFQLRKCEDPSCCLPPKLPLDQLEWLPDPQLDDSGNHYLPYASLKGVDTTDEARPSAVVKAATKKKTGKKTGKKTVTIVPTNDTDMVTTTAPTNDADMVDTEDVDPTTPAVDPHLCTIQHARAIVSCTECDMPRVIYSMNKLSERQSVTLALSLSEYIYTCGGPILPPTSSMFKKVMCRSQILCSTPIEVPYYGSNLGRIDLCCFCGRIDCMVDALLKQRYKTVLPICEECKKAGKVPFVCRPYGLN